MSSIFKKISLTISPYFFLLALVIGFLNSNTPIGIAIWVVVIFFSILFHEFGHALSAVFFGQRAKISLIALGGLTSRSGPKTALWKDFVIVFAGPAVGLLIALSLYPYVSQLNLKETLTPFAYAAWVAFFVNAFWTIVNLLPMQPLDGGHLVRILFEGMFGLLGVKIAYVLSFATAIFFTALFFGIGQIFIGALFVLFCFDNWRALKSVFSLKEHDRDEEIKHALMIATVALEQQSYSEAVDQLEKIRKQTKKGVIYHRATVLLARALKESQEKEKAFYILKGELHQLDYFERLELQRLAYDLGDLDLSIELGNQLFIEQPASVIAELQALAHARKGEFEPAVGWIEWLIGEKGEEMKSFLSHPIFDNVRHKVSFE